MNCVYKIVCKDKNITEFYIGSTINFNQRKRRHESDSTNLNSPNYCFPLYMFINVNGGWNNWDMIVLKEYKFITNQELNIEEQKFKDLLKPKLNDRNVRGSDMEKKK